MPSNALTLTTAYIFPSISLVTTGTTPHFVQMWNSAVFVPKTYCETLAGSATETISLPVGQEVHTLPCFMQNEQVHARAGISVGAGSHSNLKEMFPQWQLPPMSMNVSCTRVATSDVEGNRYADEVLAEDQAVCRRVRLTVALGLGYDVVAQRPVKEPSNRFDGIPIGIRRMTVAWSSDV